MGSRAGTAYLHLRPHDGLLLHLLHDLDLLAQRLEGQTRLHAQKVGLDDTMRQLSQHLIILLVFQLGAALSHLLESGAKGAPWRISAYLHKGDSEPRLSKQGSCRHEEATAPCGHAVGTDANPTNRKSRCRS